MADTQGNSSSSATSTLDSLSSVDDGTEQYPNPEIGEGFFQDEEQEGEGEGEDDDDEEGEGEDDDDEGEGEGEGEVDNDDDDEGDDDDDDDDDEEEEEEEDEEDEDEEEVNSAAVRAENPFQVSTYLPWQYSRRAEIRRVLRALRGEPDEDQNKRCTRCKAMGHVCLDCPLPIRFIPRRRGYVPQQNPMQPNEALFTGEGESSTKGRCTGSSSQEADPETAVPSVSSASASQLGKRKSVSGSRDGLSN